MLYKFLGIDRDGEKFDDSFFPKLFNAFLDACAGQSDLSAQFGIAGSSVERECVEKNTVQVVHNDSRPP